jgi:hypothetical protein
MNTKIFGELGAAVGVHMLAYSVCSLIPVDRPSSEKTVSKNDLRRLTKDDYGWPADAELDVARLPVLAKNLAKNFMNTVTPVFPKKTMCKPICMPGSSFMHIMTYKCIQKQYHVRKREIIRDLRLILETKAPNSTSNRLGVAYA